MRYDIYYDFLTDSYTVQISKCDRHEGRYTDTVYEDGYSWSEYGASEDQVRDLGLELPEE